MEKYKHLNRRGKIMVSILSIFVLIIFVKLVGSNKEEASAPNEIPTVSAEQLTFSFGPKKAFADSQLDLSIQEKKRKAREKAQAKKRDEQRVADQKAKAIYLTFDDGPSPEAGELLDILDQYNAKATFFMLGPHIESHPKVVERMVEEGFGIGMHGMTHNLSDVYGSKEAPLNEMTEGQGILQEVTGIHTELVRLPYGSIPYLTEDMRQLLDQNKFSIWDWNVDSRDWELKDRRFIRHTIQEIQSLEHAGEAPVVLLHDKPATIKYLPELLSYLQEEGYETKVLTNEMTALTFKCNERCYSIK